MSSRIIHSDGTTYASWRNNAAYSQTTELATLTLFATDFSHTSTTQTEMICNIAKAESNVCVYQGRFYFIPYRQNTKLKFKVTTANANITLERIYFKVWDLVTNVGAGSIIVGTVLNTTDQEFELTWPYSLSLEPSTAGRTHYSSSLTESRFNITFDFVCSNAAAHSAESFGITWDAVEPVLIFNQASYPEYGYGHTDYANDSSNHEYLIRNDDGNLTTATYLPNSGFDQTETVLLSVDDWYRIRIAVPHQAEMNSWSQVMMEYEINTSGTWTECGSSTAIAVNPPSANYTTGDSVASQQVGSGTYFVDLPFGGATTSSRTNMVYVDYSADDAVAFQAEYEFYFKVDSAQVNSGDLVRLRFRDPFQENSLKGIETYTTTLSMMATSLINAQSGTDFNVVIDVTDPKLSPVTPGAMNADISIDVDDIPIDGTLFHDAFYELSDQTLDGTLTDDTNNYTWSVGSGNDAVGDFIISGNNKYVYPGEV